MYTRARRALKIALTTIFLAFMRAAAFSRHSELVTADTGRTLTCRRGCDWNTRRLSSWYIGFLPVAATTASFIYIRSKNGLLDPIVPECESDDLRL